AFTTLVLMSLFRLARQHVRGPAADRRATSCRGIGILTPFGARPVGSDMVAAPEGPPVQRIPPARGGRTDGRTEGRTGGRIMAVPPGPAGRPGRSPQRSCGQLSTAVDRAPGRPTRSTGRHARAPRTRGAGMGTGTGPVGEPVRGTVRGSVRGSVLESAGTAGIGRR